MVGAIFPLYSSSLAVNSPAAEHPVVSTSNTIGDFAEFQKRGGFIFAHFLPTFYETMLGFLIGALVGVVSALGIVYSRILWITIYPSLVILGSVPRIAIAPLILIWLGIDSIWSKVTIAFLVAFFPMVVNSVV